MLLAVVAPLVLVANGLAAGVLVGTQLGNWPLLAGLPADQYVRTHAFFSTRYDPFMPVCLLGTAVGDGVLAGLADTRGPAALWLLAAVLAVATVVVSLTKNVPVNKWVRTVDPEELPADFADLDPRPGWGRWNRVRTVLATLALAANCAAIGVVL
ncbi:anthrone oxygenase family protein [Kutzneria sp. NPDC052558]|uniref:anthrone oxygenase family protein n=1 Tax=Kutzneria sp. NPDC052558 TaxID=3364121 RepID=UPI0037C8233B